MQGADLFLFFENAIGDGLSGCMGKKFVVSVKDINFLGVDFNKLHGLWMSQPLPHADLEFDKTVSLEKYYQKQITLIQVVYHNLV